MKLSSPAVEVREPTPEALSDLADQNGAPSAGHASRPNDVKGRGTRRIRGMVGWLA